jgi:N-acyl-D-amino-acid deacylase
MVADLVIRGGSVMALDGDGSGATKADVAIEGDRIVAIGAGLRGRRAIDATGMVVAPGFIDIHTHSDFTLPVTPSATAKLLQGVTTDVTGNCGFSPFPLPERTAEANRHGAFFEPRLGERWPTLAAFGEAMADLGPAINVAPLIGLGAVRLAVLGEEDRPPTESELDAMRALVRQTMSDGAFGVSSGLVYAPSAYAGPAELAALAAEAARHGGFYASHIRDERHGVRAAVAEAMQVGRDARCPVQISHHKVLGRENWGEAVHTLADVDEANADGHDVTLDVYPYTAGSTTLITLLPSAELSAGEAQLRRRLRDPGFAHRMLEAVRSGAQFRLEEVRLAVVPSRPELEGKRLPEAAESVGADPAELVLDLIAADGSDALMLGFGIAEDDLVRILTHPRAMVGSDGWTMSTDDGRFSHPRNFGCAPRLLAHYVRERGVLSLEDAIRKLTLLPARRLGLANRGMIAPGLAADIAVFDLESMADRSTYDEPVDYPVGVRHVIVNGRVAVEDGQPTGVRSGRMLSRVRAS